MVPACELACCPDKLRRLAGVSEGRLRAEREPAAEILRLRFVLPKDLALLLEAVLFVYAVLLGRSVRSRTCVRMLDICIPLSCETNGRISAMN
jgi:hypothetical protein